MRVSERLPLTLAAYRFITQAATPFAPQILRRRWIEALSSDAVETGVELRATEVCTDHLVVLYLRDLQL